MKKLILLIGELKGNISQKYWLFIDTSYMWLYYPHILYDNFFIDRRALLSEYAIEMCLTWNPPIYNKESNHICVLVHHMSSESEADCFTKFVLPVIKGVQKKGYIVHLIDLGSHIWDSGTSFIRPLYWAKVQVDKYHTKYLYSLNGINVYYSKKATMTDRQQELLNHICQINPYCILDASDECSAISYYYKKNYPTIFFTIRSLGYSSSFFHKYMYYTQNDDFHVYPPINIEQVLCLPIAVEFAEPKRLISRNEYGVRINDIIVVTVGNRLSCEVSDELIHDMCTLLYSTPNLKWFIVGCEDLSYITKHFYDLLNTSIIFIRYEKDLPALYKICDIYLNPNRIGGGTSLAWAMQQGLAIASPLSASITECYIGTKNAQQFESDLIPFIKQLTEDKDFLDSEKEKNRRIASKWSIDSFVNNIFDEIGSLVNDFTHE